MREMGQFTKEQLAELSALADGTLDRARQKEVEARIAASPELSELYERERLVVRALQEARASDRAPAALRARVEAQRPSARQAMRRRAGYGTALAGALAAAALAVALALPAGTPGAPSLSQAAALGLRAPATGAPTPDPSAPGVKLARSVDEVYFPNWSSRFGWRAVGARSDRIDGRLALTVYYAGATGRVAYTIVAPPPLSVPAAQLTRLNGIELRTLRLNGRTFVTWNRSGHTCVLWGAGVPAGKLRELASWKAPGARD